MDERDMDVIRAITLVAVAAALEHRGLLPQGYAANFNAAGDDAVHTLADAVDQYLDPER